jgi:hypothetical protein
MASLNSPPNPAPNEVPPVSASRTAIFLKKYGGLILLLVLVAAVPILWLATSKISGEVDVPLTSQEIVALPGASVTIYSLEEDQQQRITGALAKIQQTNDDEKAANARVFQIPAADERTRSDLAGYNNLSDTKHCFALEGIMDEIRKSGVHKKNTDSQGRFTIRELPGKYLLEIVGQANDQRFEFIENVDLKWRSNLKLTEPSCHYSLAN